MRKMLTGFCFVFAGLAGQAFAVDCDQTQGPPTATGPGPVYKGYVAMPDPLPDGVQWECFFKNTGHIIDVVGRLRDAKDNLAPYIQYDLTVNRTYYADQSVVKLSFQPLNKKVKLKGLKLEYSITFDQAGNQPGVHLGESAVACSQSDLCIAIVPNGDFWVGNPRGGNMLRQGNLYGTAPDPNRPDRRFSLTCDLMPGRYCVAFDNEGNWFAGAISGAALNDTFHKRN